jgi:hypothetical protein
MRTEKKVKRMNDEKDETKQKDDKMRERWEGDK